MYIKGKAHFESIYNKYKSRANRIQVHKEEEALYDTNRDLIKLVIINESEY